MGVAGSRCCDTTQDCCPSVSSIHALQRHLRFNGSHTNLLLRPRFYQDPGSPSASSASDTYTPELLCDAPRLSPAGHGQQLRSKILGVHGLSQQGQAGCSYDIGSNAKVWLKRVLRLQ